MNTTLTILHPGIETPVASKPRLAPRLATLEGKRVALLDNGKVNGGALLAAVAAKLKSLGIGDVRVWKKQHAAQSADKLFPELLGWKPDLMLTAIGD
jgi:hypothetical protein